MQRLDGIAQTDACVVDGPRYPLPGSPGASGSLSCAAVICGCSCGGEAKLWRAELEQCPRGEHDCSD